ncbi:primosomal protein N' [Lactobacillus sp. S2-2]|uniref:primosomal protein N' n=1 Tax=Lactobacillus sp. S2-2 TaxID=2692917 RepID=UPI001F8F7AF4|nr:primosomal protein N' [Lactobacillus sp. S2-2]
MKIAEVIVDVPTMQTNIPYSYIVPSFLEQQIKIGMRVVIPFGKGNRKIEGFVIELKQSENDETLKSIDSLMDLDVVVNDELLNLSDWLAKKTYSFRINCLLTMLPSVMKAKYEKFVHFIGDMKTLSDNLKQKFEKNEFILFDNEHFSNEEMTQLLKLKEKNLVEMIYQVNNQAKVKKELLIVDKIKSYDDLLGKVRKNATNQIKLINVLRDNQDKKFIQSKLTQNYGINLSTINLFEKNNWIEKQTIEKYRDPYEKEIQKDLPKKLNKEQDNAVKQINQSIEDENNNVFLLEGVTGSGKTEVYLQVISKAIGLEKTALMLVPEISLTPQMVRSVKNRFGKNVAVLHSGLSKGEKFDEWRRINRGEVSVVVGARSAIFSPLKNIGVIIIDEEHDGSYKQNESPRYDTKEVAKKRAEFYKAPLILGSATPSLESRARAEKGIYKLLLMPNRINNQTLPEVSIIDMKEELQNKGETNFSDFLINEIKQRIIKNEQVVLMLNKRGFSSFIMCRDCGYVLKCPNCDISLTMHLDTHTMKCHYCGHEEAIPNTCHNCGSSRIRYYGTGTEKVEQELKEIIQDASIIRMDVDTTRKKGSHEKLLNKFGNQEANILLGTQMIAKGLDFPNVTLVGVLNADTGLDLPDFRSSERTYQLLTQVSGRAGRAEKEGKVIIQTFNPDNYAIQLAKEQNYEKFFFEEMKRRHFSDYAPYFFSVRLSISSEQEDKAAKYAFKYHDYLSNHLSSDTIILGPTPRPIARMKNRYYYQIIIKYKKDKLIDEALNNILNESQKETRKGLRISIDPEPLNFM